MTINQINSGDVGEGDAKQVRNRCGNLDTALGLAQRMFYECSTMCSCCPDPAQKGEGARFVFFIRPLLNS